MLERLVNFWVYGGVFAAMLLLALLPFLSFGLASPLAAIYLTLPFYMLHQFEEHDDDRFRKFLAAHIGRGRDVLSRDAVFIINVPGVWGVNLLALYLAYFCDLGFGLIAVYLMAVNAVAHSIAAFVFRRYNPGLITAVLLFIPASLYAMCMIDAAGHGGVLYHLIGCGSAIFIHFLIVMYARRNAPNNYK